MRKRTSGFLDRSISGLVAFLRETVSNDAIAVRKGFLQRCDPRLKCLNFAILLIAVLLSRNTIELAAVYALTLVITAVSSISMAYFLKRTLFFIPVFAGFIIIPALFDIVIPGDALYSFHLFHHTVAITRQGVGSAAIFLMRVLTSVSLAVLLVLTTRHHVLLKSLRVFRVPQLFVMTLGMTYRYIFLFLDNIQSTLTAVRSRVGFVSSSRTGRRIVTVNMAGLWLRSYRLQTQVYQAMLSRGYTGEPRVLDDFTLNARDFYLFAASLLILAGTLWLNRFFH